MGRHAAAAEEAIKASACSLQRVDMLFTLCDQRYSRTQTSQLKW